MNQRLPTPQDVHTAAARLTGCIVRTPMLRNAMLDAATGATVLVKPEVLQRTGSFKLRGATNALLCLPEATRARGVVAYSSGNHAQGVACAAASFGVPATIIMPSDAPAIKRDSTAFWGAKIIPYDRFTENREAIAAAVAAETGATLIPPYDHPDIIAGQGTAALELAMDAATAGLTLDLFIAPAGGGGLMAGSALALSDVSPSTSLHTAEPEGWDDTARSLATGERLRNDMNGSPFCDALLSPMPGALTFAINQRLVTSGFTVSDVEVRAAQKFAARTLKLVTEPGGAVALAALLSGKATLHGKVVGLILSGGNTELE
ncbi:threonine ammonia-lyase [Acidocella aminolytica]|uniref:Threonine dehydratase n=1 Tax=Acidocella aminolytica 101 = DSM 11237 TaxID=1120923 RepID=A0A0D6PJK7_9PROT|nr:threonine/serine dehydratase [Acidocella aminolytica]GAN80979.1 threonine dehydratase [Acidocella aminolytica 101 = DSM 11237]GBQ37114.1 threonine dehydratase [Acidocella aminolytica 101 = DSM 11237]SHF30950.1 threonine dehydratase [Acidocella aminolytica 101 = DSM 11237]